jgi:hypothetical protein
MAIVPLPDLAIPFLQNLDRRHNLLRRLPFTHRDLSGNCQLNDGAI